ncbi:MAG: terminase small subunit [Deltaproteobacteria bacterium]
MTNSTLSDLTPHQQRFVQAYLGDAHGDTTEAARQAGYSGSDATLERTGASNLEKSKIRDVIEALSKSAPQSPPSPAPSPGLEMTRPEPPPEAVVEVVPGPNALTVLQPPATDFGVETTEVRTSSLSDGMQMLWRHVSQSDGVAGATVLRQEARALDYRPRRWYRHYDLLRRQLLFAEADMQRSAARVEAAAQDPLDVEGESGALTARHNLIASLRWRDALRDERDELIREIASEGYELRTTPDPIIQEAHGYDFHLVGPSPYPPIDLGQDASWTERADALDAHVREELSEVELARFREVRAALDTPETAPHLASEAERREKALETARRKVDSARASVDSHAASAAEWSQAVSYLEGLRPLLQNPAPNLPAIQDRLRTTITGNARWFGRTSQHQAGSDGHLTLLLGQMGSSGYTHRIGRFGFNSYLRSGGASNGNPGQILIYFEVGSTSIWCCYFFWDGWQDAAAAYASNNTTAKSCSTWIEEAIGHCARQRDTAIAARTQAETSLATSEEEVASASAAVDQLAEEARRTFLDRYNRPPRAPVDPSQDPLQTFLSGFEDAREVVRFRAEPDGYYGPRGERLSEWLASSEPRHDQPVALLPTLDEAGLVAREIVQALASPRPGGRTLSSPTVRFVETHQIRSRWKGYCLGPLAQTVNLFPGESRELVVETTVKTERTSTIAREGEQSTNRTTSTSFEENLEDQIEESRKTAAERKQHDAASSKASASSSQTHEHRVDASVEYSGFVTASAKYGYVGKSSRQQALEEALSTERTASSSESREGSRKNLARSVEKAARATSSDNRISVSFSESWSETSTAMNRTVVRVDNPNLGRTVNYNFFQLQNSYEVSIDLVDVKIVVGNGVETAEGTGIEDVRVIELEEFARVIDLWDSSDPRTIALATHVARQSIRRYGTGARGALDGVGVLDLGETDATTLEAVMTDRPVSDETIAELRTSLQHLSRQVFAFREAPLVETRRFAVNVPAYYLEAEVGARPATEGYLEERRDIETDRQRALVAHQVAQTAAGVFHSPYVSASTVSPSRHNGVGNGVYASAASIPASEG